MCVEWRCNCVMVFCFSIFCLFCFSFVFTVYLFCTSCRPTTLIIIIISSELSFKAKFLLQRDEKSVKTSSKFICVMLLTFRCFSVHRWFQRERRQPCAYSIHRPAVVWVSGFLVVPTGTTRLAVCPVRAVGGTGCLLVPHLSSSEVLRTSRWSSRAGDTVDHAVTHLTRSLPELSHLS